MKNANDRACPEQFKVHSADASAGCDARTDGDDDNHGSVEVFAVVVVAAAAAVIVVVAADDTDADADADADDTWASSILSPRFNVCI